MDLSSGDTSRLSSKLFDAFLILVCISVLISIHLQSYLVLLLPALVIGFSFILDDYRRLFYLLFAILPFSVEFYFDGIGIGTDIPSEPIMIILSAITIAVLFRNNYSINYSYITNPIIIALFIHVFWILITAINSDNHVVSFKYLAAKIWYILPFLTLPLLFIKESKQIENAYGILYKFLFVSICIVLVRHATHGFSFAASYEVVRPFFRNHVNYAAISVICLPFVWAFLLKKILYNKSIKWMSIVFIIFIIGIYFSFTRAAILSMVIAVGAFYVFQKKWVKQALLISSLVAVTGIIFLSWNNKYMDFAPNFERTITHTEFDNLLEATYKLEDISSMERVYRWMAGIEMIKDKFWLGFGPGCFYSNYKSYSISRFQTYVSDNPDKSGIHNYFLMTWVEQGFIGFIILIALCFTVLLEGERIYHICTNKEDQYLVMAACLGFIIIFAMCLINDLIETDKVGPFFFFNMAILLFYSNKYKNPAP